VKILVAKKISLKNSFFWIDYFYPMGRCDCLPYSLNLKHMKNKNQKLIHNTSVKLTEVENDLFLSFCNQYDLNKNEAIRIALHNLISKSKINDK
jgi:hypothetical protein